MPATKKRTRKGRSTNGHDPNERPVVTIGYGGRTPQEDHGLQWAQCRPGALGHEWKHDRKPLDPELNRHGYRPPAWMNYQSVGFRSTCNFCHTTKVKWIDLRTKEVSSPRYYHPEGYARRGEEALDMTEWRNVWLVTTMADVERENGDGNGKRATA
jgi:hypothetical protein